MAGKVTILPFNETFDVEDGESLLWSILRHGRYVRYGCKSGGCSTCRAQIVEGDCRLGLQTSYSLSDHDRATGIVLLCSSFLDAGDVVVDVADTMDLTEEQYHAGQEVTEYRAEVDRLDPLTHDIRWLGLRLQGSAAMPFSAGQYVEVAVPGSVDEWRSYSMANGPEEDGRVDLVIKVIPGGRFSTGLDERLRRGDEVRLRGPFGQFGVRLSHRPMVMVAGGSGMAPILAMLADLEATGNRRPVTFFYGARTDRDLFLVDRLEALAARRDWFRFIPVLSEPERNEGRWAGETGLVTEAIGRHMPTLAGHEAYLCGPPPMIDAAIDVITGFGCKPNHVYFDRFVPSGSA